MFRLSWRCGSLMLAALLSACAGSQVLHLEKDVSELKDGLEKSARANLEFQRQISELDLRSRGLESQLSQVEEKLGILLEQFGGAPFSSSDRLSVSEENPSVAVSSSELPLTPELPSEPGWALDNPSDPALLQLSAQERDQLLSSPDELYSAAFHNFQQASYHKAILQFNVFVERYPRHDLTDNAIYWIGECWYGLRNYPRSIMAFDTVLERFSGGNKAPDALLKKAYALHRVGDDDEAMIVLRELINRFPRSSSASKAESKLQEILASRS